VLFGDRSFGSREHIEDVTGTTKAAAIGGNTA